MPFSTNQAITAHRTALELAAACSHTLLAGAERLVNLNLETARALLHDSVSGAKSLLAAQAARDVAAIQAQLAKPALETTVAYSRSVKEIAAQMHLELAELADTQTEQFCAALNAALDEVAALAPAGSTEASFATQKALVDAQLALANMKSVVNRLYGIA